MRQHNVDPWLPELVRCVDAGESIIDNLSVQSSEEKIEALTGLICRAGDESSAALLVLLSTLENSNHPKALANTAKHLAFTHCGELNVYRIVDTQIALLEGQVVSEQLDQVLMVFSVTGSHHRPSDFAMPRQNVIQCALNLTKDLT